MTEEKKKSDCPECEQGLKDRLIKLTCEKYPKEKQEDCKKAIEEYFKRDKLDPDEYVKFMKEKGLWQDDGNQGKDD